MDKATVSQSGRMAWIDHLRVFATFAVVVLHAAARNWYSADVRGFEWRVLNVYNGFVRWGVPVFIMISGALFLNRDIPVRQLYGKYILRMALAFIAWSAFYALQGNAGPVENVVAIIRGHYHMWFVLMIIGLYMCQPLYRRIVTNDRLTRYLLVISIAYAFGVPMIVRLVNDFGREPMITAVNAIRDSLNNVSLNAISSFAVYFILGYILDRLALTRKVRLAIYALGIIGLAMTVGLDQAVALRTNQYCDHYYELNTVNILLESIAMFTLFKYGRFNHGGVNGIMQKLAKYSFGAYLVHAFALDRLYSRLGLDTMSFNPLLSVMLIAMLAFALSMVISAVLNHIPVLKRYVV